MKYKAFSVNAVRDVELKDLPPPGSERVVAMIPAHNESECIEATVRGILAQTRLPDQVVVICDNCTDDTYEKAAKYPVEVIRSVGNREKKAGALNWAWHQYCQDADIVVCLDADTVLSPDSVESWLEEFHASPSLDGSSSRFTMRGSSFLVGLQRSEFSRWTDTGLRRGWTSVLAGTGCALRNDVLRLVVERTERYGPWAYESTVEDFELTYQIRGLGYHCQVSPRVRAYTDAMDTIKALWAQRMKWQTGTIFDLFRFGFRRLTMLDWFQQAAGLFTAVVRALWVMFMISIAVFQEFHFLWYWLLPPVVFVANDVKQSLRIPHRTTKDIVMAAVLLPSECFAWLRAAWFIAAWTEVIRGRLVGTTKDRWSMQYAAEAETVRR